MGTKNVLIKGGHLKGKPQDFFFDGKHPLLLDADRIVGDDVHGTGCTLASAITAGLAKGKDIVTSVKESKKFIGLAITGAVRSGRGVPQVEPLTGLYQNSERYSMCERVFRAVEIVWTHFGSRYLESFWSPFWTSFWTPFWVPFWTLFWVPCWIPFWIPFWTSFRVPFWTSCWTPFWT